MRNPNATKKSPNRTKITKNQRVSGASSLGITGSPTTVHTELACMHHVILSIEHACIM